LVFIGTALDDGPGQLVAGPADVHGIFFLGVDVEAVAAVAAAYRNTLQFDQYLAVVGHRRLSFQKLEEFWSDKSRSFHARDFPLMFIRILSGSPLVLE